MSLSEELMAGLSAPLCLSWELTWACNLRCVHCLSDSGRRDPRELSTVECVSLVEELADAGVFYLTIGGGEPMLRRDFFTILEAAERRHLGVKFSTNGTRLDREAAERIASMSYVAVQVSVDGPDALTNDRIRGRGSFAKAMGALGRLAEAGVRDRKLSMVVTSGVAQRLEEARALAAATGAQLRLTRLRPSGRAADRFRELAPSPEEDRLIHRFLLEHPEVETADSFFHLNPLGERLKGLSFCGAGRVVCLIDPIGDVYACPFTIHPQFRAGSVRTTPFLSLWRHAKVFADMRATPPSPGCQACHAWEVCHGGCVAAKVFTGHPVDGPDPACVRGRGGAPGAVPVAVRPSRRAW
jgi:mycofactocin radical SAM maturase